MLQHRVRDGTKAEVSKETRLAGALQELYIKPILCIVCKQDDLGFHVAIRAIN